MKVLLLGRVTLLGVSLFIIIILSSLVIFAFYLFSLQTNVTLFNGQQVFIAFVFVFDFFLLLPIIFPIRYAASGANVAAIGKNPPFCVLSFPNINLLVLKYGFLTFFMLRHFLVCLRCTPGNSL